MAEPRRVGRQPGWREVLIVAGIAVAVVLGLAVLTSILPTGLQEIVFHTPLAILVLIVGTGWLLWRISRQPPARPEDDRAVRDAAPARAPLERRAHDLAMLTGETWDVVIVGGGIVGVGALLDAVSRGMRAALVEQDDIAAGHLIALVAAHPWRAALSRAVPLRPRPRGARRALATPLACAAPGQDRALLFPIYGIPYRLEGVLRRGADALRHPRGAARRRLASPAVAGGHARLAPTLITTGSVAGSSITTGSRTTRATRWPWLGPRSPRETWRSPGSGPRASVSTPAAGAIAAVTAEDLATGATFEIRTRAVVDATGVWAAEPDHPFKGDSLRILPSRGAHLVVPRERIPNTMGSPSGSRARSSSSSRGRTTG